MGAMGTEMTFFYGMLVGAAFVVLSPIWIALWWMVCEWVEERM